MAGNAMKLQQPARTVHCSFCGKSQYEVDVMLAGPVLVAICCECVDVAVSQVAAKRTDMALAREAERCAFCIPAPIDLRR